MDLHSAMISACRGLGVVPPESIPEPGRWVGADIDGDRNGKDDARIKIFPDGEGGIVWNWKQGEFQAFFARSERALTPQDRDARRRRVEMAKAEATAEEARRRETAKQRAVDMWTRANPELGEHAYLRAKGIQPHGIRTDGVNLMIPMRSNGELWSVQTIPPDGKEKRFLKDGRKFGCYYSIGKPNGVLCVCEGFATGASIHEATGYAVAVAFDAGNLKPVAAAMRARFPNIKLIVCADDDYRTEGNPGIAKATEAARAVGGLIAVPDFGGSRGEKDSDFNDLHVGHGLDAVKRSVEAAKPIETTRASNETPQDTGPRVTLLNGADVQPEPVDWLWEGWLAAGKLHVMAGAPGTGKTTIALTLAAALTGGGRWPDGTRAPQRDVAIWSGEDDAADTLAPRLHACGAEMSRIHFVSGITGTGADRTFDPAMDMPLLMGALLDLPDIGLLIVDPIVSAVAVDSHKNGEVRRALQPLVDLGAKVGCAVLGISHFSKGTAGKDPVERVTGSIAFGALARVVLATAKITEEEGETSRLLARAKSNIGPDDGGYRYSLEQMELSEFPGVFASRVLWGAAVPGTARELLAMAETTADPEDRSATDEAADWLRDVLGTGSMKAADVQKEAKQAGISDRALRRARERLGIKPFKGGFSDGWRWQLPAPKAPHSAEDAQDALSQKGGIFEGGGHLRAGSDHGEEAF